MYEHTSIICHGDVVMNCCPRNEKRVRTAVELCRPVVRVSIMGWWLALCEEA
jgi:hypothetical protein